MHSRACAALRAYRQAVEPPLPSRTWMATLAYSLRQPLLIFGPRSMGWADPVAFGV